MDLNKAQIIGRLTRDPEVRTTPGGANVASFSVATNFTWTNAQGEKQENVEYHNVVVWRKLADIVGQYLRKGRRVYVEGRLQTREWNDNQGIKKYKTEVVIDEMIILSSNKRNGSSEDTAPAGDAAPSTESSVNLDDLDSVLGDSGDFKPEAKEY